MHQKAISRSSLYFQQQFFFKKDNCDQSSCRSIDLNDHFPVQVNLAHKKPTLRIQNPPLTSYRWPSLGCGYQAKSLVQRGLVAKLVLLNVTSKGPPSFSPGVHYCNAPPIFCQLFHNTALVKMPGQGAPWTQSWSPLLSRRETFSATDWSFKCLV